MEKIDLIKKIGRKENYNDIKNLLIEHGVKFEFYSPSRWEDRLALRDAIGKKLMKDFGFEKDEAYKHSSEFSRKWKSMEV